MSAGGEVAVETLPDNQLLALCDTQMPVEQQEELSALLERNHEGALEDAERSRLDELMRVYRQGQVRRARAINAAVVRGLRPQLS